MKQLYSHWTDFLEHLYLSILENLSGRFKFQENLTITDTLHEDRYIIKGNDPLVICTSTE